MMQVHEILHTIVGEGARTGMPCALVRTHGCNLECRWCDTPQGNVEPRPLSVDEIARIVLGTGAPFALITGGEPLLQQEAGELCRNLLEKNVRVLVETNGTIDLSGLPREAVKIMDLKPPSSGFCGRSLTANLAHLDSKDEVKIVVAGREDYLWAGEMMKKHLASYEGTINLSPLLEGDLPSKVAGWMIEDGLKARLNLQLHKIVFPAGEHAVFPK